MVHSVPDTAAMQSVAELIKSKRVGQMFISNDVMANPYDEQPSYWSELLTELHRPWVIDASFEVPENASIGALVGTLASQDPDPFQTLTYQIISGNTANAFSIDGLGRITVAGSLVYEATNLYNLVVQVTDSGNPSLTDTAAVAIQVGNIPEFAQVTNVVFGDGTSQRSIVIRTSWSISVRS